MDAMFFIVLGATLVSFLLTLAFGRFVIPMLRALHAGQSIREVGPQWHNSKAGTPTMGGIMFIAAILLCTVGFGWKSMVENADYTHLYVLGLALCYGLVGFADDFVKVKLKRNLGLTASQKFLLQLVVAVIFLFVLKKSGDLSCDLYIPFWNLDLEIPTAVYDLRGLCHRRLRQRREPHRRRRRPVQQRDHPGHGLLRRDGLYLRPHDAGPAPRDGRGRPRSLPLLQLPPGQGLHG